MEVAPLFKPFRALGYITDNVPFAVNRRGKETYVTVSIGKAFQVYNCTKLTLSLVGPQLPGYIRALACTNDLTFAAVGNDIVECKRLHRSGVYRGAHAGPIRQLLLLGPLLLSLGGSSDSDRRLVVWEIGKYSEPQRVIEFPPDFLPTTLCHPDTYLNKVLVGAESGQMQLCNIRTGTMLFCFKGWGSAIQCLVSSPALDVVGVGLADGRAVLHNIRVDKEVASFANAAGTGLAAAGLLGGGAGTAAARGGVGGGACTALSFRSGAGVPLMAAGGGGGVVTVWHLEERRLHTVIKDAHDGVLLSLHFFPGEPLLMSSAADNSLKHWVFDSADAMPRLLRFRAGHAAPPTIVRHYGQGGLRLLSAGCDRSFRIFSVHQDQQSRELSQGHIASRAKRLKVRQEELKLERVVDMDACEIRERDWANVLTAHEGDSMAYTWRLAAFSRGDHVLQPPAEELRGRRPSPVTSVALSHCGNFGIVGSTSGRIDRYNMQSGIHRGAYYRSETAVATASTGVQAQQSAEGVVVEAAKESRRTSAADLYLPAHRGAVVGCASDGSNRRMVSVGLDSVLRVWEFRSCGQVAEVALGCPAVRLALHPTSSLAAVALADASLLVYDVEVPRLVRRFKGHSDRITGLHVSADSRWLLSSSMDGTLRVWDIPAAQCLQVLKLGSPITSLSLSPTLDLLATTHLNRRGIYLWSNQILFGAPVATPHSSSPVPVVRTNLPTISTGRRVTEAAGEGGRAQEQEAEDVGKQEMDPEDEDGSATEEDDDKEMPDALADTQQQHQDLASEVEVAPYNNRDPVSGAPLPLAPDLVTLSLLPRSHWDSLTRIEVIKARNKPLQPPKKPEAAPFFLPTLPGLSHNPVFDPPGASTRVEEGREGGEAVVAPEEKDDMDEQMAAGGDGSKSRVVRMQRTGGRGPAASSVARPVSPLVHQLRLATAAVAAAVKGGSCSLGEAGVVECYGPVLAMLRKMSPTAIDRELRAMQVLEGCRLEAVEEADLAALMDMLVACLEARRDFEFCQALLSVVLAAHGDVICRRPTLAARADRLRLSTAAAWGRLDSLLQHVRALVGFFGNLQQA